MGKKGPRKGEIVDHWGKKSQCFFLKGGRTSRAKKREGRSEGGTLNLRRKKKSMRLDAMGGWKVAELNSTSRRSEGE